MSAVYSDHLNELPIDFSTDQQVAQLRVPPHSIEAESSVLGGLLLDNGAWDRVGDLLVDGDFYRHEHQLVYAAIGALINASKPADVITVFEHLQNQGHAQAVGGLGYLNSLAQYVPSASNIRRYAEIVRERSILRKLVSASDEIATAAFNPKGKQVDKILDEAEQKIFNIGEEGSRMKQGFQSMDSLVVELLDRVQEMADNPNDITGVPTGFYDLDRMTSGFQAGDMVVLAARPSASKVCESREVPTALRSADVPMRSEASATRSSAVAAAGAPGVVTGMSRPSFTGSLERRHRREVVGHGHALDEDVLHRSHRRPAVRVQAVARHLREPRQQRLDGRGVAAGEVEREEREARGGVGGGAHGGGFFRAASRSCASVISRSLACSSSRPCATASPMRRCAVRSAATSSASAATAS